MKNKSRKDKRAMAKASKESEGVENKKNPKQLYGKTKKGFKP